MAGLLELADGNLVPIGQSQ